MKKQTQLMMSILVFLLYSLNAFAQERSNEELNNVALNFIQQQKSNTKFTIKKEPTYKTAGIKKTDKKTIVSLS